MIYRLGSIAFLNLFEFCHPWSGRACRPLDGGGRFGITDDDDDKQGFCFSLSRITVYMALMRQ